MQALVRVPVGTCRGTPGFGFSGNCLHGLSRSAEAEVVLVGGKRGACGS